MNQVANVLSNLITSTTEMQNFQTSRTTHATELN